jgi:hypothetical protein
VPNQGVEEGEHGASHARRLHQESEKYEQGDRQENEMRYPLLNPANENFDRYPCRERQVAEGRQAKAVGNRNAAKDTGSDQCDKKDREVPFPRQLEERHGCYQHANEQRGDRQADRERAPV